MYSHLSVKKIQMSCDWLPVILSAYHPSRQSAPNVWNRLHEGGIRASDHRSCIYSRALCSLNHHWFPLLLTDEGFYVLLMVWPIIPPHANAGALEKLDMTSWMTKAWMQVNRSPAPELNSINYIQDVMYQWIGCHSGCNDSPRLPERTLTSPSCELSWVNQAVG